MAGDYFDAGDDWRGRPDRLRGGVVGLAAGQYNPDREDRGSGDCDDHAPGPVSPIPVDPVHACLQSLGSVHGVHGQGVPFRFGLQGRGQVRLEVIHDHASIRSCRVAVARNACCFTEPLLTPSHSAICSSDRSRKYRSTTTSRCLRGRVSTASVSMC